MFPGDGRGVSTGRQPDRGTSQCRPVRPARRDKKRGGEVNRKNCRAFFNADSLLPVVMCFHVRGPISLEYQSSFLFPNCFSGCSLFSGRIRNETTHFRSFKKGTVDAEATIIHQLCGHYPSFSHRVKHDKTNLHRNPTLLNGALLFTFTERVQSTGVVTGFQTVTRTQS